MMLARLVIRDSLEVKGLKQAFAVNSSWTGSERLLLNPGSVWACIFRVTVHIVMDFRPMFLRNIYFKETH